MFRTPEGCAELEQCVAEAIRRERLFGGDVTSVGWTQHALYEVEIDDVVYRQVSWLDFSGAQVEGGTPLTQAERERLIDDIRRGFGVLRKRAGSGALGRTFICGQDQIE